MPPLQFESVFGTFFGGCFVVREIKRAFLAAAAERGSENRECNEWKQQTLHWGAILEKSMGRSIPSTHPIAYAATLTGADTGGQSDSRSLDAAVAC